MESSFLIGETIFFPKSRSLHLGGEHKLHYKKRACQAVKDVEADCNYQEENQHGKNLTHISRRQIKSNLA